MTTIIQAPAGAAVVEVDASPEGMALAAERASKEDPANH
jgi:hypothetical protein